MRIRFPGVSPVGMDDGRLGMGIERGRALTSRNSWSSCIVMFFLMGFIIMTEFFCVLNCFFQASSQKKHLQPLSDPCIIREISMAKIRVNF